MPEQIIFIWSSRRMCTYWVDRVSSRKILQSTIDATPPSSARFLNLRRVVLYVVIHCYELVGDVIFFITYLSGDTIQQEVRKAPSPWYEMHMDLHLISNLPSRWWGFKRHARTSVRFAILEALLESVGNPAAEFKIGPRLPVPR